MNFHIHTIDFCRRLQLQQTLEAAQRQEVQYKTQMDLMNSVRQIQDSLQVAQQQEHQFKQMEVLRLLFSDCKKKIFSPK